MNPILWRHVDSSHIQAVWYDKAARELHVRFHRGGDYVYQGVQPGTYQELINAPSIGEFFTEAIKGVYDFRKAA